MKRKASRLPPFTSKATMGPPPAICRLASSALRMIVAAGIEHADDFFSLREKIGDRRRRRAMALHPQRAASRDP